MTLLSIHYIRGLPEPIKDLNSIYSDVIYNQQTSQTSSLYIASYPVGAQIFIDNIEQTGFNTPSMITDIPAGQHRIKLISPGFIDVESYMPLESGRTYNLFLTMGRSEQSPNPTGIIILLLALGIGFLLLKDK